MTTPTKASKAPAKKAATKTAAPAFDLSTLAVKEAPAPVRGSGTSGPNPFLTYMRDSWAKKTQMSPPRDGIPATYKGAGKMIERVPNANVTQVTNLLRAAATAVGNENNERVGAAIQVDELNGADKGFSNVRFAAKTAKQGRKTTAQK